MCRIIGIISATPVCPIKYLFHDECSLYNQALKGWQADGWGVGYYENGKLIVEKSEKPIFKERERFLKLCSSIRSNIIIAHVRKASNPRNLPLNKLIGIVNSQPFYYNNIVFAHNGTLYLPDEIMEVLGEYRKLIKGVNDSEVYFALLMKEWNECGDVVKAIKNVEKILWEVFKRSEKKVKNPYSSLNSIFSDGEKLYALNLYLEGRGRKSLCYGDTEVFRMVYSYYDDYLVVASERTNNEETWKILRNGDLLVAEVKNDRVEYKIIRIFERD